MGAEGSKLHRVCKALLTNEKVAVEGQIINSRASGGWTETVDILTGPKQEILDPTKLNEFMLSLIPGLEPLPVDTITAHGQHFSVGKLYFDEPIGLRRTSGKIVTTAHDSYALARAGMQVGSRDIDDEEILKRRTWVRMYPNADLPRKYVAYLQAKHAGVVSYNDDKTRSLKRMSYEVDV